MSEINDCLKMKLKWEECSTNLIVNSVSSEDYKDKMDLCFLFYNNYINCIKNTIKNSEK